MSRPVPVLQNMNRLYFEGCAQGELRIRRCTRCEARFHFAYEWCPKCWSLSLSYERASGRGVVSHFCVVHQPPYPAFDEVTPYILALIELSEGVRIMSNVLECPPEAIRVGLPVVVRFEQRGDVTLPMFVPE
jgi:uncharacterized OB-fold protein